MPHPYWPLFDLAIRTPRLEIRGYEDNGSELRLRRGKPERHLGLRLSRERWSAGRRTDIELVGLAPCLELFGVEQPG